MKTYHRILRYQQPMDHPCRERVRTIDAHTGGEPLRIVLSGVPMPEGNDVLSRRAYMRDKLDLYRRMLMHEPRGHADMYGCLPVPPNDEGADFGVIFMHNAGYSTMCGHAIIALAKLTVEMGWKPVEEPETRVVIDAPCGRIEAFVKIENGKPKEVSFLGVPSFAVALDQQVEVDGYGEVTYDLAFGGTFYAYVCAEKLDLGLDPSNLSAISKLGMVIKDAVASRGGSIA
ncbi:MAG: proline racemase family protein, partial [Saprospiraceae bacterium]|nr:proline racemase family protein [Saprospiraceae bacterium]